MIEVTTPMEEAVALRLGMRRYHSAPSPLRLWFRSSLRSPILVLCLTCLVIASTVGLIVDRAIWPAHAFMLSAGFGLMLIDYLAYRWRTRSLDRAFGWRSAAHTILFHMGESGRPDQDLHNHAVCRQVLMSTRYDSISNEHVEAILKICSMTTKRNAALIGTYLRLMLMAEAEERRHGNYVPIEDQRSQH